MSEAPLVRMRELSKHYGGVRALDRVSLDLYAGEVLGLLGHNGAGKSTLIRLLSGVETPDGGRIEVDGSAVRLRKPRDAREHGIETLHQDLALADNLDATANLFLGRERRTRLGLLDEEAMERAARDALSRLRPEGSVGFPSVDLPVSRLSGGQRQSVAIARALHFRARVLVLDEPTAALGPAETRAVGALVRRLAAQGLALLLVSHDLHDVFDLSDRIAVMRAGRLIGEAAKGDLTRDQALAWIVSGRGSGGST